MSFPDQVKDRLMQIISEMAEHPENYSKHPGIDFTRNKKLCYSKLLHLIVSMEAGSIKDELLKYFSYDVGTISNSAFFQQRAKLSQDALPYLFHTFNSGYSYLHYKNKYQLLACDGSSFSFTRNSKDPDAYFAPDGKTTNGYNQIHVVPLFDIINKRYTDCVIQPIRKKNEFQALCDLIDQHRQSENMIPVFIADRGFHSLNVFAHAIEHQAFFLIRATDVKMQRLAGKDLPIGQDCFDIEINRILTRSNSKKKMLHPELESQYKYICPAVSFDYIDEETPEYSISLRVLRFKISEDGYENIITNLPTDEFSMDEIKSLYNQRWQIETSFRVLKHVIGALNFHSKKREYIEMEVWARLLLYNICSIITQHVVIERKGRMHLLQVNFSVAFKTCHHLIRLHNNEPPTDVEGLIRKNVLPIRPDRKYARQHRFRVPASFTYRF